MYQISCTASESHRIRVLYAKIAPDAFINDKERCILNLKKKGILIFLFSDNLISGYNLIVHACQVDHFLVQLIETNGSDPLNTLLL